MRYIRDSANKITLRTAVIRTLFICVSLYLLLNIFFIIVFIALTTPNAFAEDRSKKEFWINTYGETESTPLSLRAHEVFDHVLAAADRRAGTEPGLYIIDFDGFPWAQSLADRSIIITKNGLDFCYRGQSPEQGDARFAFVAGHELAHQFNGDFWHYKFLRTADDDRESIQAFQDIRELAKKPDLLLAKELQADQYGIIYAVLAGYNSDEIISGDRNFFLEWARKETPSNDLPKSLASLSKKRAMAVSIRLQEVSEKMALFQLGVVSYHIGRYDDALILFERFASYFPGREIYANIGTTHLRIAYDKFLSARTPESFPFLLSFGPDIKSRAEMINVTRGFTEDKYIEYRKLLGTSLTNLKKAVEFDPFYPEAKNSLGCAYIIGNKYYDAVSILEEALDSSPDNSRIRNNLAIAYILLGQELGSGHLTEKAEKILITLKETDQTAKTNWYALRLMQGKNNNIPLVSGLPGRSSHDLTITFDPHPELKPGGKLPDESRFIMVEEISKKGKNVLRVLADPGKKIILLTDGGGIRLALYKGPITLKTNIKIDEISGIYISDRKNNGLVLSKRNLPDFFEF